MLTPRRSRPPPPARDHRHFAPSPQRRSNGRFRPADIVFFVVLSSWLPGATIRPVSRWLRQATPQQPRPAAVLEINAAHPLAGEIASFRIEPEAAVCGASLADLYLPPDAAVLLVVRGPELLAARGPTVLLSGDHVHVFFHPQHRAAIHLLFGPPERA